MKPIKRNAPGRSHSSDHRSGKPISHPSFTHSEPAGSDSILKKGGKASTLEYPPLLESLTDDYIREKTGKETDDPEFLDRLRQSVMAQKAVYWKREQDRVVKYGRAYDTFSYLAYHMPVYFCQFRSLLQMLARDGILPEEISMLDLGTGPGVAVLAAISLQAERTSGSLEVSSVELSDEHREAFGFIVPKYASGKRSVLIHPPIKGDLLRLSDADIPACNIISLQNVIAELTHVSIADRAAVILKYVKHLADDGILIIVEPAELSHATALRKVQRELIRGGLYVYGPCTFLWGSQCDPSSCWTFCEGDSIQATSLMKKMGGDDEAFRFVNTDLKYSWLIMTKRPLSRCTVRIPKKTRMVRLSQLEKHNGRVVSVTASRMSGDIGTKGMHLFKLCDGTCRDPVFAVLSGRNRRPGHSVLFTAEYGQVLMLSDVQVKRHQHHDAWNLIINQRSSVRVAQDPGDQVFKPTPDFDEDENYDDPEDSISAAKISPCPSPGPSGKRTDIRKNPGKNDKHRR
ncbi:MAG TPA: small ribosomal subunit Rsm22 family protein [Methanospirillum sp.]|nr:small ribosomal subunit Rsm22 family protein [Methanospirillum sp.]